jgi:hypothetical protein
LAQVLAVSLDELAELTLVVPVEESVRSAG